jgi:hypothetical protein
MDDATANLWVSDGCCVLVCPFSRAFVVDWANFYLSFTGCKHILCPGWMYDQVDSHSRAAQQVGSIHEILV